MFESEPILWVQAFASGWLTALMIGVSEAGSSTGYLLLLLAVMFGVSFRSGLVLLQLVLWQGVLTDFLKDFFGLPRPAEIDAAVSSFGEGPAGPVPLRSDADGFLELPDAQAIEYFRGLSDPDFGFPSGHVSIATTFWMGGAALFRSRPLAVSGAAMIALTAASRMYLGRHYLGDVLGGLGLGLLVVAALVLLRRGGPRVSPPWSLARAHWAPGAAFALAPLALLAPWLTIAPGVVGRLVAASLLVPFLTGGGVPPDGNRGMGSRLGLVAISWVLFATTNASVESAVAWAGWGESVSGRFIDGLVPLAACVIGTISVGRKLGLYAPRTARLAAGAGGMSGTGRAAR